MDEYLPLRVIGALFVLGGLPGFCVPRLVLAAWTASRRRTSWIEDGRIVPVAPPAPPGRAALQWLRVKSAALIAFGVFLWYLAASGH